MIGGVLGAVAVLAVVLVISFASSGPSSKSGCIYATIPAATGAQQVNLCGTAARSTCATVRAPGAFTPRPLSRSRPNAARPGCPSGLLRELIGGA